jgi:hypothetical protein
MKNKNDERNANTMESKTAEAIDNLKASVCVDRLHSVSATNNVDNLFICLSSCKRNLRTQVEGKITGTSPNEHLHL